MRLDSYDQFIVKRVCDDSKIMMSFLAAQGGYFCQHVLFVVSEITSVLKFEINVIYEIVECSWIFQDLMSGEYGCSDGEGEFARDFLSSLW